MCWKIWRFCLWTLILFLNKRHNKVWKTGLGIWSFQSRKNFCCYKNSVARPINIYKNLKTNKFTPKIFLKKLNICPHNNNGFLFLLLQFIFGSKKCCARVFRIFRVEGSNFAFKNKNNIFATYGQNPSQKPTYHSVTLA